MGMHEPGWREKNEEMAWEGWRADALAEIAHIRAAIDRLQKKIDASAPDDFGRDLGIIDTACEGLWARRHGPENPDA